MYERPPVVPIYVRPLFVVWRSSPPSFCRRRTHCRHSSVPSLLHVHFMRTSSHLWCTRARAVGFAPPLPPSRIPRTSSHLLAAHVCRRARSNSRPRCRGPRSARSPRSTAASRTRSCCCLTRRSGRSQRAATGSSTATWLRGCRWDAVARGWPRRHIGDIERERAAAASPLLVGKLISRLGQRAGERGMHETGSA